MLAHNVFFSLNDASPSAIQALVNDCHKYLADHPGQAEIGHLDRVVVAVAKNAGKQPLFALDERLAMVRKSIKHLPNAEVDCFDCLLVDYVEKASAHAIIRGLRAISDFEFEFQLALMNRKLNERIETIFMMPKDTYTFLSSRIVKEIARLGGDVSAFVPAHVRTALTAKLGHQPSA